ncbi:MAG: hypothetical protein LJE96_12815 [Deltaproteobacteria bacterium]|nr:hypothetical protein [Deltaproteobacteria bacterium]
MSNDQNLLKEEKKAPSPASDLQWGSDTNESDEIIELTDVIRKGKDPSESYMDAPLMPDEEAPDLEQGQFTEKGGSENIEAASKASDEMEEIEEPFQEDDYSSIESSDFKFDDALPFEAPDTEQFPEPSQKHIDDVLAGLENEVSDLEKPEDILADFENDDFEPDEGPEKTTAAHDIQGLSEERMKALLAEIIQDTVDKTVRKTVSEVTEKVLQETVDKAVRETVSEVAEKVIREAIDALKNSIASSEL